MAGNNRGNNRGRKPTTAQVKAQAAARAADKKATDFTLTSATEMGQASADAKQVIDHAATATAVGTSDLVASAVLMDERIAAANRPPKNTPYTRQRQIEHHYLGMHSKKMKEMDDVFVAAAMVMDPSKAPTGGFPAPNAVTRTWQHAAWGYTRSVPELNAAMMFVGNCLSRCKLVVGKRDPDGSVEQGFDGDEPVEGLNKDIADEAAQYINQLKTARGGQSEMLRSFGEKIFIAGECYLVPIGGGDDEPELIFDVLSTQELMPEGDRYVRYYGPGWGTDPLPDGTKPIRVWRCDGQYQMLSTSSVRACLEILEELVVLTRLVRAAAISRMSLAGILAIPDELDTPDDDTDTDGQSAEAKNPLAVDIINTGAKAIDDPASAAAWMPYLLQGPAEFIQHIKHISFQTSDAEQVIQRTEAVERLARGLDLPPEKVLGHMQTTYANAGQISEDNFNLYIEPALQMICDALTSKYLWPAMAMGRNLDPEHLDQVGYPDDIMSVAITYDARKLISKPDRTTEMIEVFTKDMTFMTIAISEMREALGLDPDKEVDIKEVSQRINAYRLGRIREVVDAPPTDAAVSPEDAVTGKAPQPGDHVKTQAEVAAEDTAQGVPDTGKNTGQDAPASAAAQQQLDQQNAEALNASAAIEPLRYLATKIAAAGEVTIERALERVGSRVCSRTNVLTAADKAAIADVDKELVTRTLGPVALRRILGTDDPLSAEFATFTKKVTGWARQAECDDPTDVASEATAVITRLAHTALFADAPSVDADLFANVLFGVRVPVGV